MKGPDGQLLPAERKFLANSVLERKPKLVLEIGTWYGGGSTTSISSSLPPGGKLITCDPSTECFEYARKLHSSNPNVTCFNCTGHDLMSECLSRRWIPELVFFDGAEDPDVEIADFLEMEKLTDVGTIFMCHDWDPPSRKAEKIRPYVEKSKIWKLMRVLTAPDSVGLCKYKRTI